jgi:hypothetical protein
MEAPAFDMTKLDALRRELARLNAAAVQQGLLRPRATAGSTPPVSAPALSRSAAARSADQGRKGARRMLTLLGRIPGDESPPVPGTEFTESGVVRLLAHLRKPHKRHRFRQRLLRFLTRAMPLGVRTSAGVSTERLRLVGRYLMQIEQHGWQHVKAVRAARRRNPTRRATAPFPDASRTRTGP